MDKNRLIGGENKLLWNIPGELKRFKEITTGHPIIMGRKTHESIGRVLPNRTNIIITRDQDYHVEGAEIAHSLEKALQLAKTKEGGEEVFVIGGGQIYQQALPLADRLYVTVVDGEYEGDTYFPDYSEFSHATDRQEFLGEPSYQTLSLEKP